MEFEVTKPKPAVSYEFTAPSPTSSTELSLSGEPHSSRLARIRGRFEGLGERAEDVGGGLKRFAIGAEKVGLSLGRDILKAQKSLVQLQLSTLKTKEKLGTISVAEKERMAQLEAMITREETLAGMATEKLESLEASKDVQLLEAQKAKTDAEAKLKELMEI